MRFVFGHAAIEAEDAPPPEGWRRIDSPRLGVSYLLAGLAGLALVNISCWGLMAMSAITAQNLSDPEAPPSWGVQVLTLLLYIPLHEFLHAVGHPGFGLSPQTVMVVWPARLRLGVYYDGCMSRRRWLLMRAAPLIGLSLAPTALLVVSYLVPMPNPWLILLQVLMVVNGLGAGGDIVAMILVRRQVPAEAQICFWHGKAYWHAG